MQRALALACQALARVQSGRPAEARAGLAELEKLMPPAPDSPALSPILADANAMAAHLIFEEARALLAEPGNGPTL